MHPRLRKLLDTDADTLDALCEQTHLLNLGYSISSAPGIDPLAILYDGDRVIEGRGSTPFAALEAALLLYLGGDAGSGQPVPPVMDSESAPETPEQPI